MTSNPDAPMRGMEAVLHAIFHPELDAMMSDFAEADSYVVVTLDPDTEYQTYTGPFATLDEANTYRTATETDMNRELMEGYQPFEATVVPMFSPQRPKDAGSPGA